jgi:magnesium transporter
MAYVSELLGRPVVDVNGERIGSVSDLIASLHVGIPHPKIVAVLVKRRDLPLCVPFACVAVLVAPVVALTKAARDVEPYKPLQSDLYLARDVLDKQIIDVNGIRVVRANDVELTRVEGAFYVANVDIGSVGLMRRLGLPKAAQRLAGRLGKGQLPGAVPWSDIELVPGNQPMRLKVPSDKISDLHPADLAEILSDLSRAESSKLLEALDVETVADALEEVEPDFQASLIETMPNEKVADVLEEMEPDEAADLLAELPEDRSQKLLSLMEREEADDVRRLLAYPIDTAGSIMTTEFAAVPAELTAGQAIAALRESAAEAETIFYVYVTTPDDLLVGVFSLRQLIMAQPHTPVSEIMERRLVTVGPLDRQDSVAQVVAKYDLLAVPVVDKEGHIQGIVTADDALDKIIPTGWKKRIPRLYH